MMSSRVAGGEGVLAHRALGIPIGALTIVLVGLLGRRAGGDRVGLIAAAICAGYPLMVATDGALMSETLYGALIAGTLLAAWRMLDRPAPPIALATGALIGLAALTRSEALLLVPLLAWPIAYRGGAGWPLRAAAATAATVLVIAPWTIRNFVQYERLVPISNNDSTVIAGANCDLTYSGVNMGGWDIRCISERRLDDEAAQARIWRDEGLTYAREHAGRLPAVAGVRLLRVWDLWQPRRQVMFAEGRELRVTRVGLVVYFLLCALAIAGALALRRRGRPLLILLAPAVAVCIAALVGYGVPRLRHGFEIPLMVLAAAGLAAVLERWAARGRARA
jgi:4-amino-4-deoxy-L-arabinose transferase-like glycosyltransferase